MVQTEKQVVARDDGCCFFKMSQYSHTDRGTFLCRMDEEESDIGLSGGSFIIKDPPQIGVGGEVRPRSRPKPKVKSQTVAGIALPGLAEVLNKKNISTGDVVCGIDEQRVQKVGNGAKKLAMCANNNGEERKKTRGDW